MTKKMWDNSNMQEDIEWGNIPVGNMTDEELYKKNWNLIDAMKEEQKRRNTDPDWRQKWKKEQKEKAKQWWSSKEGSLRRSEIQKQNWDKHRHSMTKALKDRYSDGSLGKKISNSLKNSTKLKEATSKQTNQIQTPDGVFPSRKAAAEHYGIHPTAINKKMQSYPDKYYYITVGNGSTGYKNKK